MVILKTEWTSEEDKLLVDTILENVGKGLLINEALKIATKKLTTRTFGAVTSRWYENFKDHYEEQIKRLRVITPVDKVNYNSWSANDELRLMNLMINYLIDDVKVSAALELSAAELRRTFKSCMQRWYNHIKKRNRLTIEQEVAAGKLRKQNLKNINEEIEEEQEKVTKLFVKPANKLTDKQLQSWNETRRYELFKIMMPSVIFDQNGEDLLALAAINFNRSASECRLVWEHYVKDDNHLKIKYNSEVNVEAAAGVVGKQEYRDANENSIKSHQIEAELPEQTDEKQTEVVSKPNELLELIQNLINRTESLEKENASLKEELARSKEIEENYKEIMNVMEKARQLVANSENM